ncbi:glycosyltransferase family 2 protein [Trichlorobacter ammonificans]|uniref:Glycosyltransferase 2-like domain-containing protein n=1 Tax=Trichlorobacter ammonificans TaxID=2916410 RepID=A0ABM9D7C1_9BACT|nr:glycosyltransferase family 2 protein [Trichlorobacter ammonificans]CAH2031076.1 protein of unknown function [Trichlorobacter ammonificans]
MRFNNISYIIPAYNCAETIIESIDSIIDGNVSDGDEIVIVNDCSTDNTAETINELNLKYSYIKVLHHVRNKGGAAARNTAVENCTNDIVFCLDSDNILAPHSVKALREHLLLSGADIAAFEELHYFNTVKECVTHKWKFRNGLITLEDCLAGPITPGASGNYLYTKESWRKAGGYPEFAGALDAWGFGFRQLATGSRMTVMPESFYYHRYGHDSYWMRDARKGMMSLTALQILIPFIDLIDENDVDYIMSREGRYNWFSRMKERNIRLKSGAIGNVGTVINQSCDGSESDCNLIMNLLRKLNKFWSNN